MILLKKSKNSVLPAISSCQKMDQNQVVLFQVVLPKYREPIFQELNKVLDHDLILVYGEMDRFSTYNGIKKIKLELARLAGGLVWFKKSYPICNKVHTAILPFDIHCLNTVVEVLRRPEKVVLFGQGFGRSRFARLLKIWMARRARSVILYSESAFEELNSFGVPAEKMFVAHNTVWISNHAPALSNTKKSFVYVGSLRRRKGLDKLVMAFHRLLAEFSRNDLVVRIVGDGPDKAALIEQSRMLNIDKRIEFLPATHDEVIIKNVYQDALAFVSPDHVGLGVVHAFAYGVPVITKITKGLSPEIENVSHLQNGYIFDGSIKDLMNGMRCMVENKELQRRLAINAYNYYVEHCSPKRMIQGFYDAICYGKIS